MEVLYPDQMRLVDQSAIQSVGIPGAVLMENAGAQVCRVIDSVFEDTSAPRSAIVFAGIGNNGGDGSVIARRLHNSGWKVAHVLVGEQERLTGDASLFWQVARRAGVSCYTYAGSGYARPCSDGQSASDSIELNSLIANVSLVVDALLGTGATGAPRGAISEVIRMLQNTRAQCGTRSPLIVSVDIPSGVDASTAQVSGDAVVARETVTFCRPKPGLLQYPGAAHSGRIWVADIGIPQQCVREAKPRIRLVTGSQVRDSIPVLKPWQHKGDAGRVVLFAGSHRYPGAACLSALGALHAGAGLVSLIVPGGAYAACAAKLTEVMVTAADSVSGDLLTEDSLESARGVLQAANAVIAGPGITTGTQVSTFLQSLEERVSAPLVLDADAINAIAESTALQNSTRRFALHRSLILTPHPGEAARLLGVSVEEVQSDRLSAARALAERFGAIIVLKGARTVAFNPSGDASIIPTGSPALATGGTGDVLAGVIGALCARSGSALNAAIAGAYIHGLAAQIIAEQRRIPLATATEVARAVPLAIARVLESNDAGLPPFVKTI